MHSTLLLVVVIVVIGAGHSYAVSVDPLTNGHAVVHTDKAYMYGGMLGNTNKCFAAKHLLSVVERHFLRLSLLSHPC